MLSADQGGATKPGQGNCSSHCFPFFQSHPGKQIFKKKARAARHIPWGREQEALNWTFPRTSPAHPSNAA